MMTSISISSCWVVSLTFTICCSRTITARSCCRCCCQVADLCWPTYCWTVQHLQTSAAAAAGQLLRNTCWQQSTTWPAGRLPVQHAGDPATITHSTCDHQGCRHNVRHISSLRDAASGHMVIPHACICLSIAALPAHLYKFAPDTPPACVRDVCLDNTPHQTRYRLQQHLVSTAVHTDTSVSMRECPCSTSSIWALPQLSGWQDQQCECACLLLPVTISRYKAS